MASILAPAPEVDLPSLVWKEICLWSSPDTIRYTAMVSKMANDAACNDGDLWKRLVLRDFPDAQAVAGQDAWTWKLRYLFHVLKRKVPAEQCGGAWLDGPERYLVRQEVPGSYSTSVIVLRHVCWIDVWAEFQGVLPGRYRVVWRVMLLEGASLRGEDLHLKVEHRPLEAQPGQEPAGIATRTWSNPDACQKGVWMDVEVAGVEVPTDGSLKVTMFHHGPSYAKHGLVWDAVQLLPVAVPWGLKGLSKAMARGEAGAV